jgi:CDP-diacylglycerol--glycerol-3-phosphate 3-phosphatidyltransferase
VIYGIKPQFQKFLKPLTNFFVAHKIHPTTINIWGLVFSILIGYSIYFSAKQPYLLILIPICAFLRTAFNALDGLVSRELKIASAYGEVLNEFLDRVSDAVIFIPLAFAPFSDIYIGSILIVLVLLSSYLGIVCKSAGGSRFYGGLMTKADRMIFLGIWALVVYATGNEKLWNICIWILVVSMIITIVQRLIGIHKQLQTNA